MYIATLTLPDGRTIASHRFLHYNDWKRVVADTFNGERTRGKFKLTGSRMVGLLEFEVGFRPSAKKGFLAISEDDAIVRVKIEWQKPEF